MRMPVRVALVLAALLAGPPAFAEKNEEIPRLGDPAHPLTTVCGWLDPTHAGQPDEDAPSAMDEAEYRKWRDEVRAEATTQEFGFGAALEWMYGLAGCKK